MDDVRLNERLVVVEDATPNRVETDNEEEERGEGFDLEAGGGIAASVVFLFLLLSSTSPGPPRRDAMALSLADWRRRFVTGGGAGSSGPRAVAVGNALAGRDAVLRSFLANRFSEKKCRIVSGYPHSQA